MLAFSPSERYPSLLAAGRALIPYASTKIRETFATAFENSAADAGNATEGAPSRTGVSSALSATFQQTAAEVTANSPPSARANRRVKVAFALIAGVGIAGSVGLALRHRAPASTHAVATTPAAPAVKGTALRLAPPSVPAPAPATRIIDVRVDPPRASIVLDDRPAVGPPANHVARRRPRDAHAGASRAAGTGPRRFVGPEPLRHHLRSTRSRSQDRSSPSRRAITARPARLTRPSVAPTMR